jgi:hypothetical protein
MYCKGQGAQDFAEMGLSKDERVKLSMLLLFTVRNSQHGQNNKREEYRAFLLSWDLGLYRVK